MTKNLKYGGKCIKLTPYNSHVEKQILLYTSMNDEFSLDDLLLLLEDNISETDLTEDEIIAILYELRAISVGDTIDIIFTCDKCKQKTEGIINVSGIIKDNTMIPLDNIEIKEVFSSDINDYVDFDADELEVDEYDKLEEHIQKYKVKFQFDRKVKCLRCNHINNRNIRDIKFLADNLSEDTIANYYKNTSDMILHGNYTKMDIDSMLPFERVIYLGILSKALEEQNK